MARIETTCDSTHIKTVVECDLKTDIFQYPVLKSEPVKARNQHIAKPLNFSINYFFFIHIVIHIDFATRCHHPLLIYTLCE